MGSGSEEGGGGEGGPKEEREILSLSKLAPARRTPPLSSLADLVKHLDVHVAGPRGSLPI